MIDLSQMDITVTIELTANGADFFNPDSMDYLKEVMDTFYVIGDMRVVRVTAHPKEEAKADKGSGKPENNRSAGFSVDSGVGTKDPA